MKKNEASALTSGSSVSDSQHQQRHFVKSILKKGLKATDGEFGRCKDILLDERSWVVRYFVIDTHKWLPFGRKLVVSPLAVIANELDLDYLQVNLSKEQIRNSPPLADHEPVSREYERVLFQYYGYAQYWMGPELAGTYPRPALLVESSPEQLRDEVEGHNHLRSVHELDAYRVKCRQQTVGHVVDFVFDPSTWGLTGFIVDTENWPGGGAKRVMPVNHIKHIEWADRSIETNLQSSDVGGLPALHE